jgi:hypothetical protein
MYPELTLQSGYLVGDEGSRVLAADLLARAGIAENPELVDMLAQYADLGWALEFILKGGGKDVPNADEMFNAVAGYGNGLLTPNGQGYDLDQLMQLILSAPPDSPLGVYLAQGGEAAVNGLIMSAAMATTGSPYYQRAMQGQLEDDQLQYHRSIAQGTPADNYYSAVKSGPLAGYFGGQ